MQPVTMFTRAIERLKHAFSALSDQEIEELELKFAPYVREGTSTYLQGRGLHTDPGRKAGHDF